MSRIAGIISSTPLNLRGLISEMKAGITSNVGWNDAAINTGKFGVFIWSGWRTPEIFRYGATVIAIDGIFYNRQEIDLLIGAKVDCNDTYRFNQLYGIFGFEGALRKINGDFSISLFNEDTEELYLARDRFGVKPLYYVNFPDHFAFASRPRGLFCVPKVTKELNKRFVAVFGGAHYRYIDNVSEESPYEQIKQLPSAHFLRVFKGRINIQRYWDLYEQPDFKDDAADLAAQYQSLLIDSVEKRMGSLSGRSAFTLSGGLDSSSILSCAVHSTGQKQIAFSSVYLDKTYDESEEIKSMLDSKVEMWNPVEINVSNVFNLVDSMVGDHDEPVATATWLSHYILCNDVSNAGFSNLFGGLGGDELNAGEYEHFFFHFADLKYARKQELYSQEVEKWAEYHNHPIYRKNRSVAEASLQSKVDIAKSGVCNPQIYESSNYLNTINKEYFDLKEFRPIMDHPFESYLKNRTYQDIFRETAPCCLRAEDRQTSKFNIDHIDPFFDHRLAEFMFRVPGELKINSGITKVLLRKAMQGILPEETRNRIAKTGWNAPAHLWFSTEKFSEELGDLINSSFFRDLQIYNISLVHKLFDEHRKIVHSNESTENHMMFFWQLINLTAWIKSIN
ncbi:asparagine synthase-related protein [Polynucleobacter sp. MWH-UH19D]|uniref:asparagine synthetase B family protein n=1 Tax=Polynucleobacter sp. MWH-UH19D TaxID=1855610 RepID=UPI0033651B07